MQTDRQKHPVFLSIVLHVCLALFTLLVILNTHSNAMTIEYLIKYIDELELEQRETQKELNKLKGEIINITRDSATLKERKEYVDRVIELLKKLDTIEKRRQELLKEARIMPHAPPVLKLVAIEVPEYFSDYEKTGAGLVIRSRSEINIRNGHGETGFVDEIMSLRIVRAPLEIRPSEPFEIAAEAMIRKSFPDEHWCNWRNDEENGGSLSIAISSKEINVLLKGKNSVESYCNEGGAKKHEWPLSMDKVWYTKDATIKGDKISLSVQFKPINKTISGSSQVYFYDATAEGDGKLKLDINTQHPFFTFDLPTDNRGFLLPSTDTRDSFGARGSNGITINIIMPLLGGLALRYEPVRETDPVLTSLSIPDHPSEFFEPLKEGAIQSVHTVPEVVTKKLDVAKKLLEDIGLVAEPKIKEPAKSEDLNLTVISQDPAPGMKLKNGSHVKLVIYGPYNSEITVPDVAGLTVQEAKLKLEAIGLKARLLSSDLAPSEALSFRVKGSEPKAGDKVTEGKEVTLIVYGKYTPTQEEQVAGTNCSHYPGSRAYWDNNAGKPLCGCFNGLQWNLANTQCVSQDVFDNEVCARDLPGSIGNGRDTNGRIICDCPQGLVWNNNRTQCIHQPAGVENNSQMDCSWKITQIKMFMSNYRASLDNILQKQMAEKIANEARNLGCNQSEINAALGVDIIIDNPDRNIGGEDECPCVDEQGRRFRVPWGQDCDTAESFGRDYNCN